MSTRLAPCIAYVNTPPYVGGAELSLIDLMRSLDRYRPHLITSGRGPVVDLANSWDLPMSVQSFPWLSRRWPWPYLTALKELLGLLSSRQAKLIHFNCDRGLHYALALARLSHLPYVVHVRDLDRGWFLPSNARALRGARLVLTNSYAMAEACESHGLPDERLRVVYNPIDLEYYRGAGDAGRQRLRLAWGIGSKEILFTVLGQVQASKGQLEFVAAANALLSEGWSQLRFAIVGAAPPGAEAERHIVELRAAIAASSRPECFLVTGFRSDIPNVLAASDVVVVPSWWEPFGRVIVEAMAAGRPVIATAAGGVVEIITHCQNGLLVPPRQPGALSAAMRELASDGEFRSRLSVAGQQNAARFGIRQHVETVQAIYDGILGS